MDDPPGWLPDPGREDQERSWNGSEWTDRVHPGRRPGSLHLPEHASQLQRALAAATTGIDAVEERLSALFDRSEGRAPARGAVGSSGNALDPFDEPEAAPAAQGAEQGQAKGTRRLFGRRW